MGKKPFVYRHSHNSIGIKWNGIFFIIIIIATLYTIYIQLDREIIPSAIAMAKIKATSVATQAINRGITKSLAANKITMEDLISYDYNDAGELISWNINSIVINNLSSSIAENTTEELQNINMESFKIPIGKISGSKIFASMGPKIKVDILPIGTVKVNYDNDIRSTGINQVNHTVWLNVEAVIQFVVPLYTDQIVVNRKMILVDKVISGKVPPSYVNIPEDDMIDMIPDTVEE